MKLLAPREVITVRTGIVEGKTEVTTYCPTFRPRLEMVSKPPSVMTVLPEGSVGVVVVELILVPPFRTTVPSRMLKYWLAERVNACGVLMVSVPEPYLFTA